MGLLNDMTEGLSEEEIQLFKQAVQVGSNIIYDKDVFHGIVGAGEEAHPQALATTLVAVLNKVEEKVGQLPAPAVLAAGLTLLYDVADAMTQAGEEVTEDETLQALQHAVQMWLQQHPDRVDEKELQAQVQAMSGGDEEAASMMPAAGHQGPLTAGPDVQAEPGELKRMMP